jgi:hypothetical protein
VFVANRPTPTLYWPAAIATDRDGNLYVADYGDHRVKKLSPMGKLLAVWGSGRPTVLQERGQSGIAVDRWGNVYVADTALLKLSPTGRVLARWGTGNLANPLSVAIGGRGNVFALYRDGQGFNHPARIEKLSPQGKVLATWHTAEPGFYFVYPGTLAVDQAGNVYVTMLAAAYCYREDCGTNPDYSFVHKLSPTGRLIARWGGKNACCSSTRWIGPEGLAVDSRGNVYLAGPDPTLNLENRIEKLSPSGQILATWGEAGCGPGQLDGVLSLSLATDGHGNIDVAQAVMVAPNTVENGPYHEDLSTGLIQVLSPTGTFRSLVGTCPGTSPPLLDGVSHLAVDGTGNVYVVSAGSRILKFSPSATPLPWSATTSQQGPITALATDVHDNVYVAGLGRRLWTFSSTGQLRAQWSLPRLNPPGQSPDQEEVRSIAVDRQGTIYVVLGNGSLANAVLKLSPGGTIVGRLSTWRGTPSAVDLWALAVDAQGTLYATDSGNHCIQTVSPSGTPVACLRTGDGIDCYPSDCPGPVAVDSRGNLLVGQGPGVEELSPGGTLLARWDEQGQAPGQFCWQLEVAVDRTDNLYVADGCNRIQKLALGR